MYLSLLKGGSRMYATLWQIIRCIMFDEHLNSDFWHFAKENNFLTDAQIREKKDEVINTNYVTFEPKEDTPYVDAFLKFLETNPVPNAKSITITLTHLRSKNQQN